MCGCEAHRSLVDCTCDCDHADDRLAQYRERIRDLEAQVQQAQRKTPGRRHWKLYIDGNHCAECSKYVEEGVGEW